MERQISEAIERAQRSGNSRRNVIECIRKDGRWVPFRDSKAGERYKQAHASWNAFSTGMLRKTEAAVKAGRQA